MNTNDLSFSAFMAEALYAAETGYYTRPGNPVGKKGDFITSAHVSPIFGFALGRLAADLVDRTGDDLYAIVDIGCGDGKLLSSIHEQMSPELRARFTFLGIDRSLARVSATDPALQFSTSPADIPPDRTVLVLSNELFDAFPFDRFFQSDSGLLELTVRRNDQNGYEWSSRPATAEQQSYFAHRGIELRPGQYADVTPSWGLFYGELARSVRKGMVVTIDYGFPAERLFDPRIRMYGTAAAFRNHQLHRDLLKDPGSQDLTAHVNFSDLVSAGEQEGLVTLAFVRQAAFLISLGATEHPLLGPLEDPDSLSESLPLLEARAEARRLVLPDGIGEEMRVLIQSRGLPLSGWPFQQAIGNRPRR